MANYPINKGIGKSAEFLGLKSQYLYLFAAGLLCVFFLVIIMYMIGINQFLCIILGVLIAIGLIWGTFFFNRKYGEFGMMKLLSKQRHPLFIINRLCFSKLLKTSKITKHEKYIESSHTGK